MKIKPKSVLKVSAQSRCSFEADSSLDLCRYMLCVSFPARLFVIREVGDGVSRVMAA